MKAQRRAVLIAGPTASGKSALALDLAEAAGGVIVNTDAMQVYDTLRVVSARPSLDDEHRVPHRLYGTVPAGTRFSTGEWLRAVREILNADKRPMFFVGGTGLYFDALLHGFADVPPVDPAVTALVEAEVAALDGEGRLALLRAEDPVAAGRLRVADPQRLVRALSVKRSTGRTLSSFQDEQQQGLLDDFAVERMVLDPDRDVLRARIAQRFETMFAGGAVEEVESLLRQGLDPTLPAMKAIGVPEIASWLAGTMEEAEARSRATIATQQYAKRQRTWFRNRFGDWPRRAA